METEHYGFVLVIDKKYWNRLSELTRQGKDIRFFVRKNLVAPRKAKKLLFYLKKQKQVVGKADFVERIAGDTEELWLKHGAESFFESPDEYRKFCEGRAKMTFVRFENFQEIADPMPKETITSALGSLVWFKPKYVSQHTFQLLIGEV